MSRRAPVPDDEHGLTDEPEAAGGDTVEDLLRLAASRGAAVPPLLVLTLLVQLLKALRDLHERGEVHGALSPRSLALSRRRAEALFDDPSRDPGLELRRHHPPDVTFLAPEVRPGGRATPASDLYGAGAVARALLFGRPDDGRLGALGPLVEGLAHPRPEARWEISKALDEARVRALELFEEWDRNRRTDRLRTSLAAALESRSAARVEEVLPALAEAAPEEALVAAARRWLVDRSLRESELRHQLRRAIYLGNVREAAWREQQLRFFLAEPAATDGDLEIAGRWLAEQAAAEERRQEGVRRSRRRLLFTALPTGFALALIVLLVGVLIWA